MTSHLHLLGFKPEKDENMSKTFITSIKDFLSFRKNVVSSAYAVYKNVWLNMRRPFMFLFPLIDRKTISKTRINR